MHLIEGIPEFHPNIDGQLRTVQNVNDRIKKKKDANQFLWVGKLRNVVTLGTNKHGDVLFYRKYMLC